MAPHAESSTVSCIPFTLGPRVEATGEVKGGCVQDTLDFRRCTPADAALLRELAARCYTPYYEDLWEPGGMEAFLGRLYDPVLLISELADPNLQFEIAYRDTVPVGFSKFHGRCDRADTPNAAYLERVYVAPHVIGLGVGRCLMDRLIHRACDLGRDWIWLQAMADAARPLERYHALGFAQIARTMLELPRVRAGRAGMVVLRKSLKSQPA